MNHFLRVVALFAATSALVFAAYAEAPASPPSHDGSDADATAASDRSLAAYSALLAAYVDDDGWVDYAALARDRAGLDAYITSLAAPGLLAGEGDDQALATLINAYNAFTLRLILDHYDGGKLDSIKDIPADQRWKAQRWNLGGEQVSLDQIEHEIIRKQFDEPRIHWALVCAAVSCPPLRNEAYTADKLEAQLADQEAYVLNFDHPRFVQQHGGAIHVTALFDWYGDDFGNWERYVRDRLDSRAANLLPIKFLDYDWRLNDVSNKPT